MFGTLLSIMFGSIMFENTCRKIRWTENEVFCHGFIHRRAKCYSKWWSWTGKYAPKSFFSITANTLGAGTSNHVIVPRWRFRAWTLRGLLVWQRICLASIAFSEHKSICRGSAINIARSSINARAPDHRVHDDGPSARISWCKSEWFPNWTYCTNVSSHLCSPHHRTFENGLDSGDSVKCHCRILAIMFCFLVRMWIALLIA